MSSYSGRCLVKRKRKLGARVERRAPGLGIFLRLHSPILENGGRLSSCLLVLDDALLAEMFLK